MLFYFRSVVFYYSFAPRTVFVPGVFLGKIAAIFRGFLVQPTRENWLIYGVFLVYFLVVLVMFLVAFLMVFLVVFLVATTRTCTHARRLATYLHDTANALKSLYPSYTSLQSDTFTPPRSNRSIATLPPVSLSK